ncbi:MAG: hypothetical protein A2V79_09290 [Betaproteobacteria bacterium RBG_16_56_24]|nr:MAG: hypothetical protein A2V79_09290 [Betaproteobacteria bacterium RBG_16_56_24]
MKRIASIAGPLLLVLLAGYILWYTKPGPARVGEHVPAKVAPQVKIIPKVEIQPKNVKVYTPKAKTKLDLPEAVKNDQNIHVIEATRVEPNDHPGTVTTVLDERTGETQTFYRREPLPWFALKKTGAIGLSYDAITGLRTLSIRQDILQIKQLYFSGEVALRSDRDKIAGIRIEYRW